MELLYSNGSWYEGSIDRVDGATVDILFEDGVVEKAVALVVDGEANSELRLWQAFQIGDRVETPDKRQGRITSAGSGGLFTICLTSGDVVSLRAAQLQELDDNCDDEVLEVETVVDRRRRRGRLEYRVLWKGFSRDHASWEPVSNLQSCREILAAFDAARTEAGGKPAARRHR